MTEAPLSVTGRTAIEVARACALEGGRLARERFRSPHSVQVKGRGNVVTETDVEVERRIIAVLAAEYPAHNVLSEETAPETDASTGWAWVIDPIDGTKNYSQGIPFWCTTLALCRDGMPVVGVTYDAVHDTCFEATEGGGAWRGEERLQASTRPDVASSVIGVDLGYDDALGASQLS